MNVVDFANLANHYFHSPLIELPIHLWIGPKLFSYVRTGYIISEVGFITGTSHKSSTHQKYRKRENTKTEKSPWHEM
jgi:hypothetical protein